jgi:hypothetical protein
MPSLGLLAAAELGVNLERLALVPAPGDRWPAVAAALLDGMDLLLLGPPGLVRPGDARRLVARAREQGTVLVVLEPPGRRCWPEAPDFRLSIVAATWEGLGNGHGHLRSRRVEVVTAGRRAAVRERRTALWLPSPAGSGGHQQSPAGSGGHQQSPAGSGGHQQSPAGPAPGPATGPSVAGADRAVSALVG